MYSGRCIAQTSPSPARIVIYIHIYMYMYIYIYIHTYIHTYMYSLLVPAAALSGRLAFTRYCFTSEL